MKLETILKELENFCSSDDITIIDKLKDKLKKQIRLETCYKTTKKTRVNAIKRVASKLEHRPALTGYGIMDDYKVVTDSYHAIAIKEENMPLEYKDNYPNMNSIFKIDEDKYTTTNINYDDMMAFYKMYKFDKEKTYKIDDMNVNINYLKNIVDVLGTNIEVYVPKDNYRPLYFKNENNEMGILLPIKVY